MSIVEKLKQKNLKISTAESCTGGMIAQTITSFSGASEVFEQGFVTYANSAKESLLGVSSETLEKHGAVSKETAYEMCEGLYKRTTADVNISVTGIAGPTGGTADKPVGLVYIGVGGKYGIEIEKCNFDGTRDEIREKTAEKALALAEKYIEKF